VIIIAKKKSKKIYRIRYDHQLNINNKSSKAKVEITVIGTQKQAIERIRKELMSFPYAKARLQVSKKSGYGWKSHSSYKYRKSKKTGRMRLVKL